jgi:DNA-directed RNA polymerase specialized sigma24 family protein
LLKNRTILKIATRRIDDTIQRFLNRNQALTAPSLWKQNALTVNGETPIYRKSEDIVGLPEVTHPVEEGDEWKRDLLEVLAKIKPRDEIDAALLDQFNWGRSHQELADELGVGVGTIHRRKARLYKQYQELTR